MEPFDDVGSMSLRSLVSSCEAVPARTKVADALLSATYEAWNDAPPIRPLLSPPPGIWNTMNCAGTAFAMTSAIAALSDDLLHRPAGASHAPMIVSPPKARHRDRSRRPAHGLIQGMPIWNGRGITFGSCPSGMGSSNLADRMNVVDEEMIDDNQSLILLNTLIREHRIRPVAQLRASNMVSFRLVWINYLPRYIMLVGLGRCAIFRPGDISYEFWADVERLRSPFP